MTWNDLKLILTEERVLSPVFSTENAIDQSEIDLTKYEPLLLNQNLEKASELVQRCLNIRKEVRELEILAVKTIADYNLFLKVAAVEREIETSKLFFKAREAERDGNQLAEKAFGDPSIERGFKEISIGRHHSLSNEMVSIQNIVALIKERFEAQLEYQNAYRNRFDTQGNAHNFTERAINLIRVYKGEFREAVERLNALVKGLKTIYNWDTDPLPDSLDMRSLDDFAFWLIDLRRDLAYRNNRETTFDVIVPLVQPWLLNGKSILSRDAFNEAVQGGQGKLVSLKFAITKEVFFDEEVRLKGFGLAFGNNFGLVAASGIDSNQTADSFTRIAARVKTPQQQSVEAAAQGYHRPDLLLGNIGLHGTSQPAAYVEGINVENISPFGDWEILLHPNMIWKESGAKTLKDGVLNNPIKDLKILFRVYIPG
jgi:hypothetical protein